MAHQRCLHSSYPDKKAGRQAQDPVSLPAKEYQGEEWLLQEYPLGLSMLQT